MLPASKRLHASDTDESCFHFLLLRTKWDSDREKVHGMQQLGQALLRSSNPNMEEGGEGMDSSSENMLQKGMAAGAAGDSTILFCSSQKDAKETGGYDRADVLLEYSCCH